MNAATRIAQRILEEQGYIVAAVQFGTLPQIGDIVPAITMNGADFIPGPLVISGTATEEEYLAQAVRHPEKARVAAARALGFFKLVAE